MSDIEATRLLDAAKQAIEALESCAEVEWYTDDDFGMAQSYDEKKVIKAIIALRQAIYKEKNT